MKSRRVTGPTRTKPPDAEATAQGPSGNQAPPLKSVAEAEPSELFAFKECQDLFRKRLTDPMLKLIPQLTGLRLHVLWHRPMDFQGPGEMPVLCPRARQSRKAGGANGRQPNPDTRPDIRCRGPCRGCLQHRWKLALSPANHGRRFIGQCGATNFCACLQVDKVCPLTLVLQARVAPHAPRSTLHATTPAAFHHAVVLARLILHDLESTARARMAGSGLDNALGRLNNTRAEAMRLRGEIRHRLPGLPESTVQPHLGSHAQKIVEAMLDYVRRHGHRPISLDEVASAMKMNASYLSALFSQTTGVTFHKFVEEARLSKAKELLRDPRNRVGEVAYAAGYASPDSFRHAFKAHEGLSPEAWRAGK